MAKKKRRPPIRVNSLQECNDTPGSYYIDGAKRYEHHDPQKTFRKALAVLRRQQAPS